MAAETRQLSCYSHYIGRVYASGYQVNVDIAASDGVDGRQVEIAQTRRHDTRRVSISPEVAVQFADVLAAVDDWDEVSALVRLLRAAAAHEGGGR